MFVTVWFGILDFSTGRITAVNAGHELPALMPAGGRFDLIRERPGVMVGARKGVRYREQEIDLTPGAKLFLYTDGVPDAHSPAGTRFGEERMVLALNEGCEKSPEDLLLHMRKAVDAFAQDTAQFDDLTMLCLEYKGPAVS
jgi:serine phosphatase RsbU (regulator of sigma subunit)